MLKCAHISYTAHALLLSAVSTISSAFGICASVSLLPLLQEWDPDGCTIYLNNLPPSLTQTVRACLSPSGTLCALC